MHVGKFGLGAVGRVAAPLEEEAHRFRSIKFQKERGCEPSMPKSKSCHCLVSPILSWLHGEILHSQASARAYAYRLSHQRGKIEERSEYDLIRKLKHSRQEPDDE